MRTVHCSNMHVLWWLPKLARLAIKCANDRIVFWEISDPQMIGCSGTRRLTSGIELGPEGELLYRESVPPKAGTRTLLNRTTSRVAGFYKQMQAYQLVFNLQTPLCAIAAPAAE